MKSQNIPTIPGFKTDILWDQAAAQYVVAVESEETYSKVEATLEPIGVVDPQFNKEALQVYLSVTPRL